MEWMVQTYRDLKVWADAIDLAPEVYRLLKKLPREENYALADQIRRAVVSIPANIAEGQARQHTREFVQYLSIAKGSLAELDTLLIIAVRLSYLKDEEIAPIQSRIAEIRMMLHGLSRRLQQKL